jgi:hypothetical protein
MLEETVRDCLNIGLAAPIPYKGIPTKGGFYAAVFMKERAHKDRAMKGADRPHSRGTVEYLASLQGGFADTEDAARLLGEVDRVGVDL